MTYHVSTSGYQRTETGIGKHNQRHFKVVASYDAASDSCVAHVYVSTEVRSNYFNETPAASTFEKVNVLKDQASIEAAHEAGHAAATAYIDSL